MAPSKPYTGLVRRLVIAFDIGTTFSGAAYSLLDPGKVPRILPITRYPGQDNGDFKIPSVLYYTHDGQVRAVGAEATTPEMRLVAEDEGLIYVEWFKLHLRPRHMQGIDQGELPQLPPGKNVIDVFSDFLKYMYTCVRKYIQESHASGTSLWESVQSRIDFVLSHPNGWEGPQQTQMRNAAIRANLIPSSNAGFERVHFVTEGEASLHFCLDSGLAEEVQEKGKEILIIDAGGGTIDLSTYSIVKVTPISVEEVTTPGCILQGSTRVNVRARKFLEAKLENSVFKEDIPTMIDRFEVSTKPTFRNSNEKAFIQFGSLRDREPEFGIRNGQLILSGNDVANFFQPCVDGIISEVKEQIRGSSSESAHKTAFFVGGFAANPWLYSQVQDAMETTGIKLCRPVSHTNKAVAEGAISFYIEHYVSVRVARFTYGTEYLKVFNKKDPEDVRQRSKGFKDRVGDWVIPGRFAVLLAKGTGVRDAEERSVALYRQSFNLHDLDCTEADILCYRGKKSDPVWVHLEPNLFQVLCTVSANTRAIPKERLATPTGRISYVQNYEIVLQCGLTEMKAQVSYMKNGVEVRGPAKVVYDVEATV